MIKTLLGFAFVMVVASSGWAVDLRLGYSSFPCTLAWVQTNDSTGALTNRTEGISQGLLNIGTESMHKISDWFALGMSAGIGLPLGDSKFDRTREYDMVGKAYNHNDEDTVTVKFTTVPLLVKANLSAVAGPGTLGLGLGVGAMLVGAQFEVKETYWQAADPDKNATSDAKYGVITVSDVLFTTLFAFEGTPSYTVSITPDDSLGLEIPLAFLSTTYPGRNKMELESYNGDNPAIGGTMGAGGPSGPALELGGFSWGVNLVYTRKL